MLVGEGLGKTLALLDDAAEKLAAEAEAEGGLTAWLRVRHNLRVRRLPSDVMAGSLRRYDRHRDAVLLDDTLDTASSQFQLALQRIASARELGTPASWSVCCSGSARRPTSTTA